MKRPGQGVTYMERTTNVSRKTKETEIKLALSLDGKGKAKIDSGIPFMDHMLSLMTAHAFMDMELDAKGDTEIDDHHTVEDIGICLGIALKRCLGEKEGIMRYGHAVVPMDEALVQVAVDLSNRPFLSYNVPLGNPRAGIFDAGLIKEFFRALVSNVGITLHIDLLKGEDTHHMVEAVFKCFGKALDEATTVNARLKGRILSTKGLL